MTPAYQKHILHQCCFQEEAKALHLVQLHRTLVEEAQRRVKNGFTTKTISIVLSRCIKTGVAYQV